MPKKGKFEFRTKAKLHSLTYPQCDIPVDFMMAALKKIAGDRWGWALIGAEDHAERTTDEFKHCGVHRHVMQQYECKSFDTVNVRYWDIEWNGKNYHPHFEPVKIKAKWLEYCMKDGEYIYEGDYNGAPFDPNTYFQANKSKQSYGFVWMANEIKAGKTLDELDDLVPGHVLQHKRKIEEYQEFQAKKKERRTPKPIFYGFNDVEDPQWQRVVKWANKNFLKKRSSKQKQLFLWSEAPNLGKTHPWAETLTEFFKCYNWVNSERQGKALMDCDYILLDEYKGMLTITDLKRNSQMMKWPVEIKYGDSTEFTRNVPMIITSNHDMRSIYKKCDYRDIESLEVRFKVVKVDTVCHLTLKGPPPVVLVPLPREQPTLVAVPENDKEDLSDEEEILSSLDDEDSEFTTTLKLAAKEKYSAKYFD